MNSDSRHTVTEGPVRQSSLSALFALLPGNRSGLVLIVLSGLGLVLPGILIPAFSRIFIDDILVAGNSHWLVPLLIAMAAVMLVRSVLIWLQRAVLLALETRYALISSSKMFHHILRLPLAFFFRQFAGEIGSRVELSNRVAKLVAQESAVIVLQLFLAVFYGLAMFAYHPILGAVGVGMGGLSLFVVRYSTRVRQSLNEQYLEHREQFVGMGMAGIQNMKTIKATAAEQDFFTRLSGYQANAKNAMNRLEWWSRWLRPLPIMLSETGTVAILGVGAILVMKGSLTLGEIVAVLALQASFSAPVCELVQLMVSLQSAISYMERLDSVLAQPQDNRFREDAAHNPKNVIRLAGQLDISNITFGYDRTLSPIVKNFSLSLRPGARVALVGQTGSGKSSIANLVCGMYEPWEGEILFDGIPESEIVPGVINLSRAAVSQNSYLFEGTIRDNISMWNSALDDADIIRAAKDACIHGEISSRPGGYDALVAEAGANFSGGQRQRLEIAKALAVNPTLLIMDEATSALDSMQEKQIDDNIRRRGVTCLIIAHRLSTIRDCDEIVVLEKGCIVERGDHQQLYAKGGLYAQLINS